MADEINISDYMTSDITMVESDSSIQNVKELISKTGHDGFPVCENGKLVGHISAKNIIISGAENDNVKSVMSEDYLTIRMDFPIKRAGRIMFREGINEILVVDDNGNLAGILTNTDIIRSQIERSTPKKVKSLKSMLEQIHSDIEFNISKKEVSLNKLHPTQGEIFKDELNGRKYEIEKGLSEPIIVVDSQNRKVVADGHHRLVAADELNQTNMNAYVLESDKKIQTGMYENAKNQGIDSVEDIDILEGEGHPHVDDIKPISELKMD